MSISCLKFIALLRERVRDVQSLTVWELNRARQFSSGCSLTRGPRLENESSESEIVVNELAVQVEDAVSIVDVLLCTVPLLELLGDPTALPEPKGSDVGSSTCCGTCTVDGETACMARLILGGVSTMGLSNHWSNSYCSASKRVATLLKP